jgi:acyl carrier protein
MSDKARVESVVFRAIERVNELLPTGAGLERNGGEPLAGPGSRLDSMGMVNLIFAIEDEASRQFGVELNLMDARASGGSHPLETVGSLVDYLANILRTA